MGGLVDPYLKLSRANEHMESLNAELQRFEDANPYTLTRYDDLENQRHVLMAQLSPVSDKICLIVGDIFYNIRSALDQLVWSLARITTTIPKRTQFPIFEANNPEIRKHFTDWTKGVPAQAITEIELLQPYNRGAAYKTHPLWRLNKMCNLDKHRRIPANGSEILVHFPKAIERLLVVKDFDDYGLVSVPLADKDKLQFHPRIAFKVNFGGDISGISEDKDGIKEIYGFVSNEVLPRFIRFFV